MDSDLKDTTKSTSLPLSPHQDAAGDRSSEAALDLACGPELPPIEEGPEVLGGPPEMDHALLTHMDASEVAQAASPTPEDAQTRKIAVIDAAIAALQGTSALRGSALQRARSYLE